MKISIILPVYNVEKYLKKCIESILSQTYKDFELIIINDGSTDQSGKICDEYINDSRIKIIHKPNTGISSARNIGLNLCRGEYICFVDSDDYLHENYLQFLYDKIKNSEYDFVSCTAKYVDENNKFIKNNEYLKKELVIEKKDIFDVYFKSNYIEDIVWNKIYKKVLFDNLRFKEGIIFEDSELIIHLLKKAEKVLFTNEPLYYYRIRQGSIMNSLKSSDNQTQFNMKKLDIFPVSESSLHELSNTKYEDVYIKRIIRYAARYKLESYSINKNEALKVREQCDFFYKKYKGYILKRKLFNLKEFLYIFLSVNFSYLMSVYVKLKEKQ